MVEVFDPVANRWEKCHPMSTARSRVGVAVVNGLLYAIGGYDGQLRLSTVEVYNPETDTWTRVRSMNSKRRYSGSRLHVLGHSLGPHGLGRGRHPRSAGHELKQMQASAWGFLQPLSVPPGSQHPRLLVVKPLPCPLSFEGPGEMTQGRVDIVL